MSPTGPEPASRLTQESLRAKRIAGEWFSMSVKAAFVFAAGYSLSLDDYRRHHGAYPKNHNNIRHLSARMSDNFEFPPGTGMRY